MARKKKIIYFSIYFLMVFLGGYYVVKADYYMPKTMPVDFAFKITFGYDVKYEINTFTNTITKDILQDEEASVTFAFTQEEMEAIYKKMKQLNIIGNKKISPSPFLIKIGEQPITIEYWEVRLDSHSFQLDNKEYANNRTTKDAHKLLELRQWIFEIVKQKDEFKKLPDAWEEYVFYDWQNYKIHLPYHY